MSASPIHCVFFVQAGFLSRGALERAVLKCCDNLAIDCAIQESRGLLASTFVVRVHCRRESQLHDIRNALSRVKGVRWS